jgi:PHD/YefM family antitoxin component YafN of YafNO toxin-antitoxin module
MPAQTLRLLGKQFVLIPKSEYDRMQAELARQKAQDRGDVAEARRRSKEPSVALERVRKRLGL